MNCPVCRNYVYDHLENLSLRAHPLEEFVRLKQLKKRLPELLLELNRCLTILLPFRLSIVLLPTAPADIRMAYEHQYLENLEKQSLDIQKDIETLILFLLETGIVSGKSMALPDLARQFLASQIVYFLETIPGIHDSHKKTPTYFIAFKSLQEEDDLYV